MQQQESAAATRGTGNNKSQQRQQQQEQQQQQPATATTRAIATTLEQQQESKAAATTRAVTTTAHAATTRARVTERAWTHTLPHFLVSALLACISYLFVPLSLSLSSTVFSLSLECPTAKLHGNFLVVCTLELAPPLSCCKVTFLALMLYFCLSFFLVLQNIGP